MKMLYILNVANRINNFCLSSIEAAKNLGIEYHIAGNWGYSSDEELIADEERYGIKIYQIDFERNPVHPANIKAYRQLKKIAEKENFDVIHCNTPIGGVVGRLVGKACNVKKVIYQAHGFHFYKGAPLINWLVYYPVEKILARFTDALITINKDDYKLAKSKFLLKNHGSIYYVAGVGIDTDLSSALRCSKNDKRRELNIPTDAFVLISVGELNHNKNTKTIISALKKISRCDIHFLVCGCGELEAELKNDVKDKAIENNVHFLGYRNDITELYASADCFIMSSFREGLSRSISEAMTFGLPCIVSKIRGNIDLIIDQKGGYLCEPEDVDSYSKSISALCDDPILCKKFGEFNIDKIREFEFSTVVKVMTDIYSEITK